MSIHWVANFLSIVLIPEWDWDVWTERAPVLLIPGLISSPPKHTFPLSISYPPQSRPNLNSIPPLVIPKPNPHPQHPPLTFSPRPRKQLPVHISSTQPHLSILQPNSSVHRVILPTSRPHPTSQLMAIQAQPAQEPTRTRASARSSTSSLKPPPPHLWTNL